MIGELARDKDRGGQPHCFTVADYRRMVEAGILEEDTRVELVRGHVFDKASVSPPHAAMVNSLTALLTLALASRATVSVRNPVRLDAVSELEPDIAILRLRTDYYRSAIPCPGDVLVTIEVADTSLNYDREVKVSLYAASGIRSADALVEPSAAM